MMRVYGAYLKSIFDLKDVILLNPSSDTLPGGSTDTETSEQLEDTLIKGGRKSFIFDGELLTLRILFFDILVIVCGLASDLVQGAIILMNHDQKRYGIAAFVITWIPGIPAAIHFLSVFRLQLVWYKATLYALLLVIFYPIIPILGKLIVIWVRPGDNKVTKEFMEAQYGATVAYAIHGCIASPIQLCYQSWLAINGIVPFRWNSIEFHAIDWSNNVNTISYPSTALCLIFSILT